ncbi:MAG TPA: LLM class flavin-dependent oxidoreductase, partial [Gammaproteobacteria bacterium]|nr:LLM class flavin-dependent oxidoreductase [Gammaproteobacteria bacterium]
MRLGLTPWNFDDLSAASLTEQASFAEVLGYESFWLPENHFNERAIPDPLMLLAGVAAGTDTIRLATTSFLLPLRNPLLAAEQVAVLDRLSHGRVLLGVGRGYAHEVLAAFNIEPGAKRRQFEWTLALMRRAWAGEPVSLDDDANSGVIVDPLPVQRPHPPIWVAAFGPKALARAGRLVLPYLASPIETLSDLRI